MSLKDRRGFSYVTEDLGGVLCLVLEKALEGYISQDVNLYKFCHTWPTSREGIYLRGSDWQGLHHWWTGTHSCQVRNTISYLLENLKENILFLQITFVTHCYQLVTMVTHIMDLAEVISYSKNQNINYPLVTLCNKVGYSKKQNILPIPGSAHNWQIQNMILTLSRSGGFIILFMISIYTPIMIYYSNGWQLINQCISSENNEAEWRIYASVNIPSLVQIMACRLVGAKPLSKPMLEYCWFDPWEQTSVKS